MAAKVEGLSTNTKTALIIGVVFVLNWYSAWLLEYPFAWCFGNWLLAPIMQPWIFIFHAGVVIYFIHCVLAGGTIKLLKGLIIAIIVFGIPTCAEILFRLGKSCG